MSKHACRSCSSRELEVFLDLGPMPLSDGLLKEDELEQDEPRFPVEVAFCPACSLVQILETVPPEVVFGDDYPYYSSFSDALLTHARRNVEAQIASRRLGPEHMVVEIASNDGYLLQYYVERGVPVLGIDPAPGPVAAAQKRGVDTIQDFFGSEVADELKREGVQADVVHANNVLAHVADTNGFVEGIRTLLKDDGLAVFEVPYVRDLIDGCEFDTIYHEHLCYFSLTALVELFRRHDLSVNHVEHLDIHGGSLRLYVEPETALRDSVTDLLRAEREQGLNTIEYYRGFSGRVRELRDHLRDLLGELKKNGACIGAYGAAAKGAILLSYIGVGRETIDWVAVAMCTSRGDTCPAPTCRSWAPKRCCRSNPTTF